MHITTELPKTSTIIGAVSNGLPVLDRIAASPREPVRSLRVLIGQRTGRSLFSSNGVTWRR